MCSEIYYEKEKASEQARTFICVKERETISMVNLRIKVECLSAD